jgi:dihydrofolate reductase
MRKVTFGGANSLDNFIARKDGAYDWLMWSDEAAAIMAAYWKTIDTILWGRKTYEVALRQSKGESPNRGMKSYVFSKTLKPDAHPHVTVIPGDAAEFVRRLKSEPGKDICLMGGGEIANPLFEAGLIDEVGFNIHPVLLGSGIPLFLPMSRQIDLELLDSQTFKNGCVYVRYRVANKAPRKPGAAKLKK